jgi:hypothetical protein
MTGMRSDLDRAAHIKSTVSLRSAAWMLKVAAAVLPSSCAKHTNGLNEIARELEEQADKEERCACQEGVPTG